MTTRGFVIAAPKSGGGKTIATLAVMRLVSGSGRPIAPFKCGPDFIDPSHYKLACGVPGRNLDSFMMTPAMLRWSISNAVGACNGTGIVVEGVMGLFDGYGPEASGSTASLAKELGLPVVLVIDASGMAQSVKPLLAGFTRWDVGLSFAGVIFNRVRSAGHYAMLKGYAAELGMTSLGFIPPLPELDVASRHLGLAMGHERPAGLDAGIVRAAETLDRDALLAAFDGTRIELADPVQPAAAVDGVTVSVARDDAFCFLYRDNIDLLRRAGASITYFSPLADETPDGDLVYLPGGYPELHLDSLAAAGRVRAALRSHVDAGGHLLAECGGFMYLCRSIAAGERRVEGCGIFPFDIVMGDRHEALGYVDVETEGNPLFPDGMRLRGHRFHYSRIAGPTDGVATSYRMTRKGVVGREGFTTGNAVGGYVHLHLGSNTDAAAALLRRVKEHAR